MKTEARRHEVASPGHTAAKVGGGSPSRPAFSLQLYLKAPSFDGWFVVFLFCYLNENLNLAGDTAPSSLNYKRYV